MPLLQQSSQVELLDEFQNTNDSKGGVTNSSEGKY